MTGDGESQRGGRGRRNSVKRRRLLKTTGALSVMGLAGCSTSSKDNTTTTGQQTDGTQTSTGPETFENKAGKKVGATFDAVKQLAKKEDGATAYATIDRGPFQEWIKGFNEAYPDVSVEHITGGSGKLLSRWDSEYKSDNVKADIFIANAATSPVGNGQTQTLSGDYMPSFGELQNKYKHDESQWIGIRMKLGNIFYNTNNVSGDAASTWMDIVTDDRWSGQKIGWDPTPNMALMGWLFETQGKEFFEKLREQKPRFVDSHTDLARFTGAGEFPVAFTYTHKMGRFGDKLPVDYFKFDPTPAVISPAVISNKAKNPNSALLFLNWLTSVEGQTVLGKTEYIPIRPEAEYKGYPNVYPSDAYEVDTITPSLERQKETEKKWKEVMGDLLG